MKKYQWISLLLLFSLLLPGAGVEEIEKNLQKTASGLPQFRVLTDPSGNIRGIRTVPGAKPSGVLSLNQLKAYNNISFLYLGGLKELDLTGISEFKNLRTLRVGAEKLSGTSGASSISVVRLDISDSKIKDISWVKNFPVLRVLYLPESVNDISTLRNRSFRSISAPGVNDLSTVCLKLGITLQVRPEGLKRRSLRNRASALPPLKLYRGPGGEVTGAEFWKLKRPRRLNAGFTGEMFPEETEHFTLQQIPKDSYAALQKFNNRVPFELSAFNADCKTLRKLDLRALRAVVINGEIFPELRELKLSGAVKGLETLKAPKLTHLYLENVEGFDPQNLPARFPGRTFSVQDRSRRKNVSLIALPGGSKLHTLKIIPLRDEFDFTSLKKVSFRNLEALCHGNDLSFLAGKNPVSLKLAVPAVTGNALALLGKMSALKELKLAAGADLDYRFLRGLKLHTLSLHSPSSGNFSPDMLRN